MNKSIKDIEMSNSLRKVVTSEYFLSKVNEPFSSFGSEMKYPIFSDDLSLLHMSKLKYDSYVDVIGEILKDEFEDFYDNNMMADFYIQEVCNILYNHKCSEINPYNLMEKLYTSGANGKEYQNDIQSLLMTNGMKDEVQLDSKKSFICEILDNNLRMYRSAFNKLPPKGTLIEIKDANVKETFELINYEMVAETDERPHTLFILVLFKKSKRGTMWLELVD